MRSILMPSRIREGRQQPDAGRPSDVTRNELESRRGKKMAQSIPKEEVRRLLDALPDEASYEDIQYHIYVQQKIDRGLEASERGDFISEEEIEQRIARWAGE
jgi:predicted transcriptional regulator